MAAMVSYINSSFLAKFLFPVREYMRRCNTVENIHKVIGPCRDQVIFVRETKAIVRKVPLVRSPMKACNSFHFHTLLIICSQPCSIRAFFLFLIPFLILEILKNAFSVESPYHKNSDMFSPLNKVKPCSVPLVIGWVTKYKYRVLWYFFFFPFLFQVDKTAELSFLCNVVSSISQLFVPRFAMTVFVCLFTLSCEKKQRDTSFEFSSINSLDC